MNDQYRFYTDQIGTFGTCPARPIPEVAVLRSVMPRTSQLPELPGLDDGVRLLQTEDRARYAIHALVLDHALGEQSDVYWIDADAMASAHPLTKLAPSERVLESVLISRAQTSYQHFSLVEYVLELLQADTAFLVATDFDRFYRDHDRGAEDGQDAMLRSLAWIAGAARNYDLLVLLIRCRSDEFSEPLEIGAVSVITYQETKMGPRFVGEDFETLVYPRRGGFQTTLAYWQRILTARHPKQIDSRASPSLATRI